MCAFRGLVGVITKESLSAEEQSFGHQPGRYTYHYLDLALALIHLRLYTLKLEKG